MQYNLDKLAVAAATQAAKASAKEPGQEEGVDAPGSQPSATTSSDASGAVRKARQLPDPTGWRLLCVVPEAERTHGASGIIKAEDTVNVEQQTTVVLFVLKVGLDAYNDKQKFPNGPWCKEGDFVMVRAYAGTRFKIHGKEFRILNDDQIDAVVEDPRGITRA